MTTFSPLDDTTLGDAYRVYEAWVGDVSYYHSIDVAGFSRCLRVGPEVHPVQFECAPQASSVAYEDGQPVGWIQAGYVDQIPGVPDDGQVHGLIRGLMVERGRADVAAALLDRALKALRSRPVKSWRAFEHCCGYAFATGMGRVSRHMEDVTRAVTACGFEPEFINEVYATETMVEPSASKGLEAIEVQCLPCGWSQVGASVRWDQFNFFENKENVGYATVIPVRRLTGQPDEHSLFVKGIAVGTRHHRRGIGHFIMETLRKHYRDEGIYRLILNTDSENFVAQKFYQRIGYTMTDIIVSYVATNPGI